MPTKFRTDLDLLVNEEIQTFREIRKKFYRVKQETDAERLTRIKKGISKLQKESDQVLREYREGIAPSEYRRLVLQDGFQRLHKEDRTPYKEREWRKKLGKRQFTYFI